METTRELTSYEQGRDKPLPSLNHGQLQFLLSGALLPYRNDFTIASELTLELGDLRVTPDLCVYPKLDIDYQRDVIRMTDPPLLAIEILSPTQSQQEVVNRIHGMLDAGVESCWLVQPATESITIFTGDEKPATVSTDMLRDPATDIEVDLTDIFEEG